MQILKTSIQFNFDPITFRIFSISLYEPGLLNLLASVLVYWMEKDCIGAHIKYTNNKLRS